MKHQVFDGEMKNLIPRVITELSHNICMRFALRTNSQKTTRQIKNKCKLTNKSAEQNVQNSSDNEVSKESSPTHTEVSTSINEKSLKRARKPLTKPSTKRSDVSDVRKRTIVETENDEDEDIDLQTEQWLKRSKSRSLNAGFSAFPKTIKNKPNMLHFDNTEIKQTHSESFSITSEATAPWQHEYFVSYPKNWKEASFFVGPILIDTRDLETLMPNMELNDSIVNSFLNIMRNKHDAKGILIFDFFVSLLDDGERFEFIRWVQKVKGWMHKIWLMPKCENGHWTLLIIVFPTNTIIYLDSLHGTPSKTLMRRLCAFIEKSHGKKDFPAFSWRDWTLFCPRDIPTQYSSSEIGVN
ncbi:PREDICTED: sentrin-specific protease 1-like [Cyphomyrmex costatus]|uniref:sentrin-specific protease 1-like n=1 Tax=Cyphomyrmex costatus TaxID=456900 RepID=UPI0008522423|nr:PREDICTED: sentrin-specific protease 1-like [Cyphomyrmex costatus]